MRSTGGSSSFARGLQTLIQAADNGFDGVRGEQKRGTSGSDTYKVTVVPSGFDRCTLFIPHRTTRKPWVHCFSDALRYREAVRQVTGVLGASAKRDGEELTWLLDTAEVTVENDEGEAGLGIRSRDHE